MIVVYETERYISIYNEKRANFFNTTEVDYIP